MLHMQPRPQSILQKSTEEVSESDFLQTNIYPAR